MKVGEKYKLTKTPSFSTKNRVGWDVEVVELLDERGEKYLAFKDKLGVSFPAIEYFVI